MASAGYPFARVTPRGNRDLNNNTIGVEYLVDQGERAYVERIEIRGNSRTRDYVIRREFDMSEGDAFNQQMITKAKRRLEALGYFSSVNISTQPGSSPDRVVVVVDVQDQSTGSFGVGAGYAAGGDGLLLEASIEEKNFLGRGQYIRISAGGGQEGSRAYGVSFTEPYFLGYRLAAGFDVNRSETSSNDDYDYEETSVVLRVTAPITEDLATTFRYNYKQMKYDGDTSDLSATYANLVDESPWTRSSVSQTLTYNTLDDTVLPREGIYATATHELAGLGGDSQFYKIYGKARYYHLLADDADIIGSVSASAGYVVPLGDHLNVFDQFTLTNGDIRGFENKGIGPRIRGDHDDPLGGTTYFTASAEATFRCRASRVTSTCAAQSLPMPVRCSAMTSSFLGQTRPTVPALRCAPPSVSASSGSLPSVHCVWITRSRFSRKTSTRRRTSSLASTTNSDIGSPEL